MKRIFAVILPLVFLNKFIPQPVTAHQENGYLTVLNKLDKSINNNIASHDQFIPDPTDRGIRMRQRSHSSFDAIDASINKFFTNSTSPETNTNAPDTNTTIPDANSTVPETNTSVADTNATAPDLSITTRDTTSLLPFCPMIRYIPWMDHHWNYRMYVLDSKLDYNRTTWNFDPNATSWNPLEMKTWDSILEDSSLADNVMIALEDLGYVKDSWDCCINHYSDYDWEDFKTRVYFEQMLALEALGWTNETWDSTVPDAVPETEFLLWKNLTEFQRSMASRKLCYTEETWNEELPLNEWPEGFQIPNKEVHRSNLRMR